VIIIKKANKTFFWQNTEFLNVRARQECYFGDKQFFFVSKLRHGPKIGVCK